MPQPAHAFTPDRMELMLIGIAEIGMTLDFPKSLYRLSAYMHDSLQRAKPWNFVQDCWYILLCSASFSHSQIRCPEACQIPSACSKRSLYRQYSARISHILSNWTGLDLQVGNHRTKFAPFGSWRYCGSRCKPTTVAMSQRKIASCFSRHLLKPQRAVPLIPHAISSSTIVMSWPLGGAIIG